MAIRLKIVFTRYGYRKAAKFGWCETFNTLKTNTNFITVTTIMKTSLFKRYTYEQVQEYVNDLIEEINKTLFENRVIKFVVLV